MNDLRQEDVRALLNYDPATGVFTWRVDRGPNGRKGSIAGSLDSKGYRQILIGKRQRSAHRLAWLYVRGFWPREQIDHVNGVRDDNRFDNLREATIGENQQNVSKRAGTTSKFLGVTWHKHAKKWNAKIQQGGKGRSLGYFHSEQEAYAAYQEAKAEIHRFNPCIRDGASTNGPAA